MASGSTTNVANGELRPGDVVVSYNANEYSYLAGIVRNIVKLGDTEHDTDNATDDVYVDFTALEYTPRRVGEIEGEFRKVYGERREFGELPLDEVIMSPDMLIRANNIDLTNRDEMDEILDSDEGAMTFCNRVLEMHGQSLDRLATPAAEEFTAVDSGSASVTCTNDELQPGDLVISSPNTDFACLVGTVLSISDGKAQVDFTLADYSKERLIEIDRMLGDLYGRPTTPGIWPPIDVDCAVMPPELLLRITDIADANPEILKVILNSGELAARFYKNVEAGLFAAQDTRTKFSHQSGTETPETIENLRAQLIDRADQNWHDYRHSAHKITPDNAYHVSIAVVARRDAREFLKEYQHFTSEQLNCLLQFADPVDLVADYLDPKSDISEMPGILSDILENQENYKGLYTLAVADGEKGYVICTADESSDFYMPNILHIQRDDKLAMYPNDEAAARAAERDGVKLIYDMPFVPGGIYLDTPENRNAIDLHFEQHRLSLPANPDVMLNLHDRLDENFADYKMGMLRLGYIDIFNAAEEISAVKQSYEYFRNEHAFTTGQAEFLLKLQNPLELVSDRWGDGIGGVRDVVNAIFNEQERTLHSGSYELATADPEAPPTTVSTQQKSNTPVSTGEKPSVMDEIRLAQKDMRERTALPKEKSHQDLAARKKSEPDL